ncbi:AprI/Inh family metalloprotease inhibitor [Microvirga solisilvae]|uniref:AprI/Inh family metalloprotease inhibitor n=1 Tax=Microvirga solisilvae TaxID=2919498 RepID=UPI001FAECA47
MISKDDPGPPAPSAGPAHESPPGVFTAPKRASSFAGSWRATDSKGVSCTIHLSSVSSLDLYKASISKCASESLRNVNTWSFSPDRIVLFSRGSEIAQLSGTEASLRGTLGTSGLALTMTR